MKIYLDDLRFVLETGTRRENRTDTDTIGIFGGQQRYNLSETFPAVTTKKLAWKAVVSELLWFIEGSGDERRLSEILHGTRDPEKKTIWSDNAQSEYWKTKAKFYGDLGRVYGVQWCSWRMPSGGGRPINQLQQLIKGLKHDPFGRRHIITAWNPGDINQMALPPCHCLTQFYVSSDKKLSCQMYQRSKDAFLGAPFNIASYALFTHMIAQVCKLQVGEFIHTSGDSHIYVNHIDQVKEQLSREPLPGPTLWLNPEIKDITKFTMNDIKLIDYNSHPAIVAPMAV